MKYVKAQNVLPEVIMKAIQEFVDGEFLYIPRKNDNQGITIRELSLVYYLSEQSIRRVIGQQKECAHNQYITVYEVECGLEIMI